MPQILERLQSGRKCSHEGGCNNFARREQDTCRWHDPVVLAARIEAEEARQRALHAAGAA